MTRAPFTFLFLIASSLLAAAQSGTKASEEFKALLTPYDEQSPLLSPDGKTMFVTIANHEQNIGGKADLGDIWISTRNEAGWSSLVHAGPNINNRAYNAVVGFSVDGKQLFLVNHYAANGETAKTQGFALSYKTSAGWTAPQNIYIPYFLNKSQLISGTIRDDVFIFSVESYSTLGGEDLYVSLKYGNGWTEPLNLGHVINTPFQEVSPWLSEDKRTLYFSSNHSRGMGSFDIYSSVRLDNGWTSWSKPLNLGPTVNSDGRELYYSKLKNGTSIFTTTKNSDAYGDIRTVQDAIIDSALRAAINLPGTVKIRGTVVNTKTNSPIANARLIFRSTVSKEIATSSFGEFEIDVPLPSQYNIEVSAAMFINSLEKLDINSLDIPILEMNFKLQPIEVGAIVNLKSVLFEQGSTTLLGESNDELDVVVDFLKSNPKVEIELEGHTDNRGDAKKNVTLSELRVQQVKNYLVAKGISGKRIRGRGYGGQRPIANSDTEEARKMNRRVEFVITKD